MKIDKIFIIILAAGRGTRLKTKEKKQFIKIKEYPLFIIAIKAFLKIDVEKEIILAVGKEDIEKSENYVKQFINTKTNISIVKGGETRNYSVYNSLKQIKEKTNKKSYIIIHDAARPFITTKDIMKVINNLDEYPAVTLGYKLKDTIKEVGKNDIVASNMNREECRGILTPQGFHSDIIWAAYSKYIKKPYEATDDTEIVYNAGYNIKIIEGMESNIKITNPYDLLLAETIYKKLYC